MAINHLGFEYVVDCCICLTLMCLVVLAELGKIDSQYRLCLLAGADNSVQIVQMQRNEARSSLSKPQLHGSGLLLLSFIFTKMAVTVSAWEIPTEPAIVGLMPLYTG